MNAINDQPSSYITVYYDNKDIYYISWRSVVTSAP